MVTDNFYSPLDPPDQDANIVLTNARMSLGNTQLANLRFFKRLTHSSNRPEDYENNKRLFYYYHAEESNSPEGTDGLLYEHHLRSIFVRKNQGWKSNSIKHRRNKKRKNKKRKRKQKNQDLKPSPTPNTPKDKTKFTIARRKPQDYDENGLFDPNRPGKVSSQEDFDLDEVNVDISVPVIDLDTFDLSKESCDTLLKSDGKSYESTIMQLTEPTPVEDSSDSSHEDDDLDEVKGDISSPPTFLPIDLDTFDLSKELCDTLLNSDVKSYESTIMQRIEPTPLEDSSKLLVVPTDATIDFITVLPTNTGNATTTGCTMGPSEDSTDLTNTHSTTDGDIIVSDVDVGDDYGVNEGDSDPNVPAVVLSTSDSNYDGVTTGTQPLRLLGGGGGLDSPDNLSEDYSVPNEIKFSHIVSPTITTNIPVPTATENPKKKPPGLDSSPQIVPINDNSIPEEKVDNGPQFSLSDFGSYHRTDTKKEEDYPDMTFTDDEFMDKNHNPIDPKILQRFFTEKGLIHVFPGLFLKQRPNPNLFVNFDDVMKFQGVLTGLRSTCGYYPDGKAKWIQAIWFMISAAIIDAIRLCKKHHPDAFGEHGWPYICIGILFEDDPQLSNLMRFRGCSAWSKACMPVHTKRTDMIINLDPSSIIMFHINRVPRRLLGSFHAPCEMVPTQTAKERALYLRNYYLSPKT